MGEFGENPGRRTRWGSSRETAADSALRRLDAVLFSDGSRTLTKRSKKSVEPLPWEPDEPVCQRYITTDCTIEALAGLLANQPDGLLECRDALVGWLDGMGEYKSGGKGSDLGPWLAMWSAAPLTVDRKTGATKTIHIPRAAVSIVGGIQLGLNVLQVLQPRAQIDPYRAE